MTRAADLNARGVRLKQSGDFSAAESCYQQAITIDPSCAEAHYNLGLLRRDLGRVDQAIQCLEQTAALRPDLTLIQVQLGELYLVQSRWADAERLFRQLYAGSQHADSLLGVAIACQHQGKFSEAIAAFRSVLHQDPCHYAALTNLGSALKSLGHLTDAITCFERAIEVDPLQVEAHVNLGNSHLECGRFSEAYERYAVAAELRPQDPQSYVNLGNALQRLNQVGPAVNAYQKAITLEVRCLDAWVNTCQVLKEIGDFEQAQNVAAEWSRSHPADPIEALRAIAICPLVFRNRAEIDDYRDQFAVVVDAVAKADVTVEFERLTNYAPECPYNLQFLDGNLRPLKEAYARIYTRLFSRFPQEQVYRPQGRRRRIGFVVTARHERAFVKLLGGVIDRLNQDHWELVLLCSQIGAKSLHQDFANRIRVLPFPERFDHIVNTIREAACDLLYYWEVGNDPTNYFLPFLRLAPIQVTSWGIQVTSGIPNVDAYLSSTLVETEDASQHYSEQLILATTLLTYQIPNDFPTNTVPRESLGLPKDSHVYGCVQNLGKFHPDFDTVLAEILRRDPAGVIVGARDHNGFAARLLEARWQATMPDVASRLMLLDPLEQSAYRSLLASCDVLLDPLHFGGVTTTYDAVDLAQPIVTLPTNFHRGRYTAACLRKIGVTDTIAASCEDYVKIAVQLATEPDYRHSMRTKLRQRGRELFEDEAAVSEHERIFEELLSASR